MQDSKFPPRPCAHCGNSFVPKSHNGKYCSADCKAKVHCARVCEYQRANKDQVTAYKAEHYEANKEEILAYQAEYYQANKEYVKARVRKYERAKRDQINASKDPIAARPCAHCGNPFTPTRPTGVYCNKKCADLAKQIRYRTAHKDRVATYQAKRYQENKGKVSAYNAKYLQANKEKLRIKQSTYYKIRSKTDPIFIVTRKLRGRLLQAVKRAGVRKCARTFELVGCTALELKAYLEAQFSPGMTWEDRSKWHIDHIIPCANFDLNDPEQQRACFHYTNLQPLWALDNLRKGKHVD